ncbi:MAG: dynamin family protein [Burkholderiales bacterium]|nr:dynamin family protein [Burkholderiales bacterium]
MDMSERGRLLEQARGYGAWRLVVRERVIELGDWLRANGFFDREMQTRLDSLLEQLSDDRITIAVVGEFSRGKSELINALFADGLGRRLLPAFPGRSTMCPTELRWDATEPPCIRLLPIETRASDHTLHELRRDREAWTTVAIDLGNPVAMLEALQSTSQSIRVSPEDACRYDLPRAPASDDDATVEIPRWRHAIVNIPHPLLEQGLVILDTPGLNALGSEPELTFSLLPSAHALLFVLALDTGLSETDVLVWREHLAPASGHESGCFAILNKIDTLWDGIRTEDEIAQHMDRQVAQVSKVLGLSPSHILPISAQKGLVAKVRGDHQLLAASGLPLLEKVLASRVLPAKHRITCELVRTETASLLGTVRAVLESRAAGIERALVELRASRGDKIELGQAMLERAHRAKVEFESKLADFHSVRSVLTDRANALFTHLGTDALDAEMRSSLSNMLQSNFTAGVRRSMRGYLNALREKIDASSPIVDEIHSMMAQAYARYAGELGLRLGRLPTFSLDKAARRMARVEQSFKRHFDTTSMMLTYEQVSLTRRFFKTIAAEVRDICTVANLEATHWLRRLIAPIETQIRERQSQLRHHILAVKRLQLATDTLEERIAELEHDLRGLVAELDGLLAIAAELDLVLDSDTHPSFAEAA